MITSDRPESENENLAETILLFGHLKKVKKSRAIAMFYYSKVFVDFFVTSTPNRASFALSKILSETSAVLYN